MAKRFIFIGLTLFTSSLLSQSLDDYKSIIAMAEQYYDAGEYAESAKQYQRAFVSLGNKGYLMDRYNAACSYALAGQVDSAFFHLSKVANSGDYSSYDHLISDTDLNSLHDDERWKGIVAIVKARKDKLEEGLEMDLVEILDSVYIKDQEYRMQLRDLEKEHGWNSDIVQKHITQMMYWDSVNLVTVSEILDERGWLGADIIGKKGNSTLFLVIQHADLETQEKYLPMMREAVKAGSARAASLALLEDRVALRQGKLQLYGSQIGRDQETGETYVLPLSDPDNVDKRRASVGLGTLAEYTKRFGFEWNLEEYKVKLPEYIQKEKNRQ